MNTIIETQLKLAEEAQLLLRDVEFVADWKQLANAMANFTRLQEFEFVSSWYHFYTDFDPVFSIANNEEGRLIGIMCLAWHKNEHFITHAGHNNAEYHGWLALPGKSSIFLDQTLQLIQKQFSVKKWQWRWLPPGYSTQYFENIDIRGISAVVEKTICTVMGPDQTRKTSTFPKEQVNKIKV